MYAPARNHPQLLDMQPQIYRRRVSRAGLATGAAGRGSRHTDASVGADVSGRIAFRNEDVGTAASAVADRCVGEERLQALAAPMGLRGALY